MRVVTKFGGAVAGGGKIKTCEGNKKSVVVTATRDRGVARHPSSSGSWKLQFKSGRSHRLPIDTLNKGGRK